MTQRDKKWNLQYEKLEEFKRSNGHCLVPQSYEHDKSLLGMWVHRQRSFHNSKKLRPDRKRILDEIGFVWKADKNFKPDDKLWHQQYEKLVEFKRKSGHCMVPFKYEQDKPLGRWVKTQRTFHENNKMRPDREKLLDEIGFVWKDDGWNQQYEQLFKFKQKKGHCMVPRRYEQDKSLGMWVTTQRNCHKYNKLRQDRKARLDAIDFVWKVVTGPARSSSTTDGQMAAAGTHQRGKATGVCSSVEEDGGAGRDEQDSKPPSLVTSSALLGSYPDEEVVQGEATTHREIPLGWTRVKLEPDC
jgi:hypothetical protein